MERYTNIYIPGTADELKRTRSVASDGDSHWKSSQTPAPLVLDQIAAHMLSRDCTSAYSALKKHPILKSLLAIRDSFVANSNVEKDGLE